MLEDTKDAISQQKLEYYLEEGKKARARTFICWLRFWQSKPASCIDG